MTRKDFVAAREASSRMNFGASAGLSHAGIAKLQLDLIARLLLELLGAHAQRAGRARLAHQVDLRAKRSGRYRDQEGE